MHNVMAALPNTGGALCSTPQSLADAHYLTAVQYTVKTRKPLKLAGVPLAKQSACIALTIAIQHSGTYSLYLG